MSGHCCNDFASASYIDKINIRCCRAGGVFSTPCELEMTSKVVGYGQGKI